MNIEVIKNSLDEYKFSDYFSTKKKFTPYLFTSSFAALVLINSKKNNLKKKKLLKKYVEKIHSQLGLNVFNYRRLNNKITLNWFKNLSPKDKKLINSATNGLDSLKGGLRIGKYEINLEPGIYLHYITRWVYTLIQSSIMLEDKRYLYQAINVMLTMCEKNINQDQFGFYYPKKMEIDLSKPIDYNEIQFDPLDVFITLINLIYRLNKSKKIKSSLKKNLANAKKSKKERKKVEKIYLNLLEKFLEENYLRVQDFNRLYDLDPMNIGFLLISIYKVRIIIEKIPVIEKKIPIFMLKHPNFAMSMITLYKHLLQIAFEILQNFTFNKDVVNDTSNAYKFLNVSIGLEAIQQLIFLFKENLFKDEETLLLKIYDYYYIREDIHKNFNTISFNKNNFDENKDINIIMYMFSRNPLFSF